MLNASPVHADDIVLEADSWCPMNCEPGSERPGFMVEAAEKIFARHGHKIVYQLRPWTRAIEEAKSGKANGIIGASKNDAPDFVFPVNELSLWPMDSFFVKADSNWTFSGIDSLKGITLGTMLDYGYGEKLLTYIKENPRKVQVVGGDTPLENNIKKLLAGRIDVLVEASPVFLYTTTKMGVQNLVKLAGSMPETQAIYIAFSPGNPKSTEYARILSNGIDELRSTGELAKILATYNLKDWK
jgi:polar amino acid transport system substrate-binding protein